RPIEIDILREGWRPRWAAWLLLAVAIAFAGDTARHYRTLGDQIALKRSRLARIPAHVAQRQTPERMNPEEYKFARQTISRLAIPWDDLFRSLEAAKTDDLALIDIDPDPSNASVVVSGEAKNYLAVLTYVARLAEQP